MKSTYEDSARALARRVAGCAPKDNCRVEIVPGLASAQPRLAGRGGHHTTPAGEECRHPSAYRAAFGNPVYCPSQRRVLVTEGWWRAHTARPAPAQTLRAERDCACPASRHNDWPHTPNCSSR